MADPGKYRAPAEVELWKERDPIPGFAKRLLEEGIASQAQLDKIRETAFATVQEAVKFAEESPWPEDDEVFTDIFV
jgi:pyruvate dehydrogenase E1 component alpha subunit